MNGKGRLWRRGCIQKPVLDHEFRAVMAFLARLEHELHIALQLLAAAVQQMHRAHQHRGVGIMATGVHPSLDFGFEGQVRILRHRQRVHIPAQQNGRALLAAFQRDHQPAGRWPLRYVEVETGQRLAHRLGGFRQVEAKLRMLVQPAAQADGHRHQVAASLCPVLVHRDCHGYGPFPRYG